MRQKERSGRPASTAGPAGPDVPLPDFASASVVGLAAGTVLLLLLVAGRYGYHRDELYFVEASKHLAWGYVDQPPLSVALVGLSRVLFGDSLVGLRLFPALADGAMVLLTGLLARELGGGRFPQVLAALAVAIGPFLIAGHLAGPTIYDFMIWALVSLLVIRILRTGRDRLWVGVGVAVGIGLLNKQTILLLVLALVVGLLWNRQSGVFRSRWLWLGALIALALWAPNLVWQVQHHWPTLEMTRNLQREHSGIGDSAKFLPIQLLLPGWWVAPVWLAGLWALWREDRFRPYRAFAIAYAVLFVLLWVFVGDRPYYLAGLYTVLLAAGAIVTEEAVAGTRRFLSSGEPRRRLVWRSRRAAIVFVVAFGAIGLPLSLPILPASVLATVPLQTVNYNLGETIGWQDLVAEVDRVYRSIRPDERASVAIVAANYGEAGAIDRYGPALGLPAAFSGHNSFWWWGPPRPPIGITIAVGYGRGSDLAPYFGRVTLAGRIHNAEGVQNDEEGAPIWLCRDQRALWPRIWADFKSYG